METSKTERVSKHDDARMETITDNKRIVPEKLALLRRKLGQKAKDEPEFRFYSLYAHIYRKDTLTTAWKKVCSNGGSPGIDGISISDIQESQGGATRFLDEIAEALRSRKYKPMPVKRVYIPKADGKLRPLGIPTIKDRVVQMAAVLILEPIFEEDFLDCSYGFRPKRSAHDAVKEVALNIKRGRKAIYDVDIKGYFDAIPHDKLMKCVQKRVTDGSVLKLVRMWLKAPIIEYEKDDNGNTNVKITKPQSGTPQGGVISPLLANLYLHWFDMRFHGENGPRKFANARLVRYADDFVIMAKYQGVQISEFVHNVIVDWLGLEMNSEKTKVVTLNEASKAIDFLGFTFRIENSLTGSGTYLRVEPRKNAAQRAKDRIRELTSKKLCFVPIPVIIANINKFLSSWDGYFRVGHPWRVYNEIDYFVRYKVIKHLRRRSQRAYKPNKDKSYHQHLKDLGLKSLVGIMAERSGKAVCGKSARTV